MGTATHKETTAAMRRMLKEIFPNTKFSVRMSRSTSYTYVAWTDGPSDEQVQHVTDRFQSMRFDGMDDGYHPTGNSQWSCCGILLQRTISEDYRKMVRPLVEFDPDGKALIWDRTIGKAFFSHYPNPTREEDIEQTVNAYCHQHAF